MRWLPRMLLTSPYLMLCLSEKEYLRVARHCRVEEPAPWVSYGAATHVWQREDDLITIVCIKPRRKRAEVYGLLVHEAVHVWQQTMNWLHEVAPGEEVEAVGIQGIAQQLIEEYMRRQR